MDVHNVLIDFRPDIAHDSLCDLCDNELMKV